MRQYLAFILLVFLVNSCTSEKYHRVTGGEFSVHFTETKHNSAAENLALFWKKNDLLAGKKQDIGLFRKGKTWFVHLVALDPKEPLSFIERKLLLDLQSRLEVEVFKGDPVRILICNDRFESVYDINE